MKRTFYKLSLSTLVAVYILILVGGVVRSTGSGMGCPDWPKCFGSWVPPSSESELPADYQEFYSNYRHEKNVRFAKYLTALGMTDTADKILNDQSIREESEFNPVKTWTEYINRLVGVAIGMLIFAVMFYSYRFRQSNRSWFVIGIASFVLVGFQGWIGSVVVSTNLTPWTVTVHMLLAIVIVGFLMYLVQQSSESIDMPKIKNVAPWMVGCIAVLLIQILMGTQVREAVDKVASMNSIREGWISKLGLPFIIHRSFSWVVVIIHAVLLLKLRKTVVMNRYSLALFLLIVGTIATGAGMAYFDIPPFLQPIHLLLATVTIGIQFLFLLQIKVSHSVTVKA